MGRAVLKIEEDALQALAQHEFRGNVRELENIIEKTIVFLNGDTLKLSDLPAEIRRKTSAPPYSATDEFMMIPVGQDMQTIQKAVILKTLKHFGGDKQKTAETLKISERKLWYKLKEYE
jgi:two-component system, NtrC family, response regulator AtoC